MKTFKYFTMAIMAIILVSCGKKKHNDAFDVTVESTTIGGKLSQYFSVVDKTYKYEQDIIDKVSVELKCIQQMPEDMDISIGIDVLDEQGAVISSESPRSMYRIEKALCQATVGQIVTVEIENYNGVYDKGTPAKIRLSSTVTEKTSYSSSYSSSSTSSDYTEEAAPADDDDDDDSYSSYSSSGSSDWDAVLDSYEKYVDKYVSTLKKASNGDMSAMTEYASLLSEAQEYNEKLANAEGELSSAQWSRYLKITSKMSAAIQ